MRTQPGYGENICSKGHKMDLLHASPYESSNLSCDKCQMAPDVEKGLYHCPIDKEDLCRNCVNKLYAVNAMLSHYIPSKKDDDEKDSGIDNETDDEKTKRKLADW